MGLLPVKCFPSVNSSCLNFMRIIRLSQSWGEFGLLYFLVVLLDFEMVVSVCGCLRNVIVCCQHMARKRL